MTGFDIFFLNKDLGYIAGARGSIVKTLNGGGTPLGIDEKVKTNKGLCLYPNPATENLTVVIKENSNAEIVDFTGRLVSAFYLQKGSNTVDISILKPGAYLLKCLNNAETKSSVFIIY